MSVEALVISGIVDEGDLKRAFQAGLTRECFEIYDEEFEWIRDRYESRRPFGSRIFKQKFPEFDFLLPNENLVDLIEELKREQAYLAVASAIDEIYTGDDPLSQDNAMDKAIALREILGDVVRTHAPNSDIAVKAGWQAGYQHMRKLVAMRANGQTPGIETGIAHFDHHFGGLQPETTYLFLGRPGDAKSFTLAKCVTEGAWGGYRMGVFSPEMTMHQHNCRFHTLLSAKPEIQEALDLDGAFRNRALKDGVGFNIKSYKRFLEWLDEELKGEIHVFTQRYRSERMSLSYIEARIEDYGLDAVIVDPIYKLRAPRRRGNRWEELGEITDALVNLSHAYNIPVVMSNQASRALVGRKGDAPDKDSSFGADSPVQESNCVIGVKHFSDERIMKYNCSKNRDGEPFRFTAKFHPNVGILEDVTPIQGDYHNQYDPAKVEELTEAMKEVEI
jgi:hypothetical protein